MSRKLPLAAVFLLLLLSLATWMSAVTAQGDVGTPTEYNLIVSPQDQAVYRTDQIVLNATFYTYFNYFHPNEWYNLAYSIDGGNASRIPKENIIYKANGACYIPSTIIATIQLPPLSDGNHSLTVVAWEPHNKLTLTPGDFCRQDTVNFQVDTAPPKMTNLSITNQTYTTSNLTLSLQTNEPTSWIGFSLDGQANITITENTTLTELANGSHNITIYASDSVGNMASSGTTSFSVEVPSQSISGVAIGVGISASAVVAAALSVAVFKKRKDGENKKKN